MEEQESATFKVVFECNQCHNREKVAVDKLVNGRPPRWEKVGLQELCRTCVAHNNKELPYRD